MQQAQTDPVISAVTKHLISNGVSPEQAGNLEWSFERPTVLKEENSVVHHLVFSDNTPVEVLKKLQVSKIDRRYDLHVSTFDLEFAEHDEICLALYQPE